MLCTSELSPLTCNVITNVGTVTLNRLPPFIVKLNVGAIELRFIYPNAIEASTMSCRSASVLRCKTSSTSIPVLEVLLERYIHPLLSQHVVPLQGCGILVVELLEQCKLQNKQNRVWYFNTSDWTDNCLSRILEVEKGEKAFISNIQTSWKWSSKFTSICRQGYSYFINTQP